MKRLIVIYSCMLLSCGAVLANLNGSDDFNDNVRDPAKWAVEAPLLTETNNRLEFTSTGVGEEDGAWVWTPNSGSYTQNWTVTVDAFNSSTPSSGQWSHIGLFAINSTDDTDFFGTALGVDTESGCIVLGGGEVDGTEYWDLRPATDQSATLRISYDATAQKLSSSFDAGDGFISLTNFNVIDWSMNSNDTFIIAIAGFSEGGFTIESDQIYVDNFEAITLPNNAIITNCSPAVSGFKLEWVPVEEWGSVVKWSTNLVSMPFSNLSVNLPYPQNSYTDTVHGADSKCFYRVDLEP